MIKKRCFLSLALVASLMCAKAQVTIGKINEPHTGAVLDLQSTNKGLKLPEVALEDISKFQLSDDGDTAAGVIVYNTNDKITDGGGKGVYVWDGNTWVSLHLNKVNTDELKNLISVIQGLKSFPFDEQLYTKETLTPFWLAYDRALLLLQSDVVSQGEVDAAWIALADATVGLRLIPNKELLE